MNYNCSGNKNILWNMINLFLTGLKNSYDPPPLCTSKKISMLWVGAWQCAKPRHAEFGASHTQMLCQALDTQSLTVCKLFAGPLGCTSSLVTFKEMIILPWHAKKNEVKWVWQTCQTQDPWTWLSSKSNIMWVWHDKSTWIWQSVTSKTLRLDSQLSLRQHEFHKHVRSKVLGANR